MANQTPLSLEDELAKLEALLRSFGGDIYGTDPLINVQVYLTDRAKRERDMNSTMTASVLEALAAVVKAAMW